MTRTIHSLNLQGLHCTPIEIEVDIAAGLPQFIIVGLPDAAVSEARDRVRSAIKNSGFRFPGTRVTVNLAPAHLKKIGSLFDVAIALGILAASGVIDSVPEQYVVGELALDGRLRPVRGALSLAVAAVTDFDRGIILPSDNAAEVSLVPDDRLLLADSLSTIVTALNQNETLPRVQPSDRVTEADLPAVAGIDVADIIGQPVAKRALEVAAAGNHNLLLIGPPGVGKSLLAQALSGLLPAMTDKEILEATMMHSLVSAKPTDIISQRPIRSPHHTATAAAIIGGGSALRPGELSLAHRGILFFDELPEFRREVLEALRQPLEMGEVTISRAVGSVTYPARCLYVAACNPCPCGYATATPASGKQCQCSPLLIERYMKKLSGPLLDRIDLKVQVAMVSVEDITAKQRPTPSGIETSAIIRQRVAAARDRQLARQDCPNAELSTKQVQDLITLNEASHAILQAAVKYRNISIRG